MKFTEQLKKDFVEAPKQAYMIAVVALVIASVALLMATRKGK